MMTLKLEYRDWPHGSREDDGEAVACEWRKGWLADVASAVVHGTIHPEELLPESGTVDGVGPSKWSLRWPHLMQQIELWTWMGQEVKSWRTLISVTFTNGSDDRWLLVERAWLLGPDGGTIERIAPQDSTSF